MSVELEPQELGFRRPFTQEVTQSLHLRNPNHDPVAFKVKTTAPKQYCVRPNSGRIEAGKEVVVQVLLQAMKEDLPPDAKCRDKFLVQSVAVTADKEFSNVQSIWQHVEQTSKSSIQEKKIRVVFLPPDNTATTPVHRVNGAASTDASTPFSPDGANTTFQSPSTETSRSLQPEPVNDTPVSSSKVADTKDDVDALSTNRSNIEQSNTITATSTSSTAQPLIATTADLETQLKEAKNKIRILEQQASEGLRQRKAQGDTSSSDLSSRMAVGTMPHSAEGVPVQIVAGLCLLSFLIAWIFL